MNLEGHLEGNDRFLTSDGPAALCLLVGRQSYHPSYRCCLAHYPFSELQCQLPMVSFPLARREQVLPHCAPFSELLKGCWVPGIRMVSSSYSFTEEPSEGACVWVEHQLILVCCTLIWVWAADQVKLRAGGHADRIHPQFPQPLHVCSWCIAPRSADPTSPSGNMKCRQEL